MLDTVEVKTSDNATWKIKAYLSRRDRRFIDAYVQDKALADFQRLTKSGVTREELIAQVPTQVNGNANTSPNPYEDDAYLVYATTGWTYPEPFTAESVLDASERVTNEVLAKMHELYDITEEARKN